MMHKVFFIADPHGDFKVFRDLYQRNKDLFDEIENITVVILGDAGFNFFLTGNRDKYLKEKLKKYPFTYFVIRGNHEWRPTQMIKRDPEKWHTEEYFDNTVYVENDYPYIKYALDEVSIYNIEGNKTLIVPGAYSVDKFYRIARHWTWNEKEQLDEKERAAGLDLIKENNFKFDIILSHTTDLDCEPIDLFLPSVDQSQVDKTMEKYLWTIKEKCKYKLHIWGHYHALRDYFYDLAEQTPSFEVPRNLMIFNNYAVELEDCLKNKNIIAY